MSREGKQQEASKLMTGEVYEEYKAFAEKLTILRDEFQAELDQAKTMANVCTIIIFVVIVATGLAIAVVTTLIGKIITNSITEPVEQIEAAVASLRKGELSNVEMLTYESEDQCRHYSNRKMCIRDRIIISVDLIQMWSLNQFNVRSGVDRTCCLRF